MRRFAPRQLVVAIVLLLGGVFALDGVAPPALAIWLLYLAPILLTVRCGHPGAASVVGFLASLALLAGFFRDPGWIAAGARGLGLFAIWAVALLVRAQILAGAPARRAAKSRLRLRSPLPQHSA